MAWSHTQQGTFQRPIGPNEKFIKLIGDRAHALGREHWSVTAKATFQLSKPVDSTDLADKCRNAWMALRFEHPSIACTAQEDTLTYSVPDSAALRSWADETFSTHPADVSADDVIAQLKPSGYATAHLILGEPAILLHFAHWRTEAYGALHLADAFLAQLASLIANTTTTTAAAATPGVDPSIEQLPWGEEVPRLVPSVEEAVGSPAESTEDVTNWAKHYLMKAALTRGAVGLKINHNDPAPNGAAGATTAAAPAAPAAPVVPQGTRNARLALTESETTAMAKAASAHGISVFAAVHASCSAATYAGAAPEDVQKPYTSTMRFSLRPFLQAPLRSKDLAAGLYTGGYMFQVPASQTWLENAQQYSKEYEVGVTPEFLQSRRQYAVEALKILQQVPPPPPPVSSEIDISVVEHADSLVARQHYYDRVNKAVVALEVLDVSVGVETLSRQVYCFAWEFAGRLQLSLAYNEAFYDASTAVQILARVKGILLAELGV